MLDCASSILNLHTISVRGAQECSEKEKCTYLRLVNEEAAILHLDAMHMERGTLQHAKDNNYCTIEGAIFDRFVYHVSITQ